MTLSPPLWVSEATDYLCHLQCDVKHRCQESIERSQDAEMMLLCDELAIEEWVMVSEELSIVV